MNPLSQLPSVDRLLASAALLPLIESHGRAVVTEAIRHPSMRALVHRQRQNHHQKIERELSCELGKRQT